MKLRNQALLLAIVSVLLVSLISGCAASPAATAETSGSDEATAAANETSTAEKPVFGFVSKTTADPMFVATFDGFEIACEELGIECIYRGTDDASAEKQIEIINQFIAQGVDGLAIIAADYDALEPVLKQAMEKGIKVLSVDSAANPNSRMVHVEFASTVQIGRNMMKSAYDIAGGEGQVTILNGDARVAVFADFEKGIFEEYESDPKYQSIDLVREVAYGYDLPDQSTTEAQALLKNYPDQTVMICPTTVAILAAGKVIQDQGLDVKVTGIGLPSEMVTYVKNGISPEFWLWDPYEYGYLAGYSLDALMKGTITGTTGDEFDAGHLGHYEVTDYHDGGTQILLGEPLKFDASNIDEYKDKL